MAVGGLYKGRKALRQGVLLGVVLLATAGFLLWWFQFRTTEQAPPPAGGTDYGAVELPPELVPPGMEVGHRAGQLAPDFYLPTLQGKAVRLSELRGRPVVVNFWATWCTPCRREMPQFKAAYDQYRDRGLLVIAVNVQEPEGSVRQFAEEFGLDFPVALDRSGEVSRAYRLLGLPATYFIDRQGVVRSVFLGPFVGQQGGRGVQGAIDNEELLRRLQEIIG